jgi:hypothetical protein
MHPMDEAEFVEAVLAEPGVVFVDGPSWTTPQPPTLTDIQSAGNYLMIWKPSETPQLRANRHRQDDQEWWYCKNEYLTIQFLRSGFQYEEPFLFEGRLAVGNPWPGNIRELENVLERATILASGSSLEIPTDLLSASNPVPSGPEQASQKARDPSSLIRLPQSPAGLEQPSLEAIERDYILTILQQTDWVIHGPCGAAKILDLHPSTLRNRMKKLGITRSSRRIW